MNIRLLAAATLLGVTAASTAFGVDRRDGTTPQINNNGYNNGYTQPAYNTLPQDPVFRVDPFAPSNGNQYLPNDPYNNGRQRLDLVSFPGTGVTPGVPLITQPPETTPRVVPDQQPQRPKNRWRIGIYSQNTNVGVSIRRVIPGSPAAIAGLEANDLIVSVGGYQVGDVNGVRHDLGNEFDLRCDENGATTLLVQDHRNGSLVSIPVQLEPRFATVTGEIVWRAQTRLPREAFAHIELRERVRPGAPLITIAETQVYDLVEVQKTQTGRAPFQLEYSQSDIDTTRQYFVVATITDEMHTLYTTEQAYPVITQQNPHTANVQMAQVYDWRNNGVVGTAPQVSEYDQFVRLFEKYMGRQLRAQEAELYRRDFSHGSSMDDALANVIAGQEFYNRSQNDDRAFIIKAHEMYTGRKPDEQTIQYWIGQLQSYNGLRHQFTRDFMSNLN